MSKITKLQKYSILWLNSQNVDIPSICKELSLKDKQVLAVIDNTTEKKSGIKTKTEPVNASKSKNLMITETSNRKKNVAIMTREASELNDDLKKKIVPSSNKINKNIYKPFN